MKYFKTLAVLATLAFASTAVAAPVSTSDSLSIRSTATVDARDLIQEINSALENLGLRDVVDEANSALEDLGLRKRSDAVTSLNAALKGLGLHKRETVLQELGAALKDLGL